MEHTPRAVADFETRSACSSRRTGSWRYSLDPTTEPLCMAFRLPYWEEGRTGLWHPAFPQVGLKASDGDDDLQELFWWILGGGIVEAHNSFFERGIWTNIMTPRYGWPAIPHRSWRCSAAKAATYALPRALDAAGAALNLSVLKDDEGSKVMKKLMKPRKPRKKEREDWQKKYGDRPMPLLYHESADLFHILFRYCRQDVLAEEAVSSALDDLTPMETEVFLLNEEMNERGFQLDMRAVDRALTVIEEDTTRLNAELCELTGGSPSKATQRTKMLEWFESKGLKLYDTQKGTIQEAIDSDEAFDESAVTRTMNCRPGSSRRPR
jgi:DNA polymerase